MSLPAAVLAAVAACALVSQVTNAQMAPLSYRPIDAEYSQALDSIVFVSANPHQLHIYQPKSQVDTTVALPKAPLNVSVGPTGWFAAVMHDGLISYVNLGTANLERIYPISVSTGDVVLANDYIYVPPSVSVRISTGAVQNGNGWGYASSAAKLHPSGTAIYTTRDGVSPNDIHKYDVSTGTLNGNVDSIYHGDYPICGPLWPSADGKRVFTGCGTAFAASPQAPAQDMRYWSSLPEPGGIIALAESVSRRQLAVVRRSFYPDTTTRDAEVLLYDTDYLTWAGRFRVPDFTASTKTFAAHSKWVFFDNTSSLIYVVAQADRSSGMLNDFGVYSIPLAAPEPCMPALSATSITAAGNGEIRTILITAPASCQYRATATSSSIVLLSGFYGSGNATLRFLVRSNPAPQSRTVGSINIGSQMITVEQDVRPVYGPARFSAPVVDAEYDKPLDRVIYVTADPPELHVLNPPTGIDSFVSLPLKPLSVSVRPDGLYAAIGHDGWISIVNLQSREFLGIYKLECDVQDLVLAGNGWVYAFPRRDWSDIYSLQLATGLVKPVSAIYNGRVPRLHPSGAALYVGGDWTSKWNIASGEAKLSNSFTSYSLSTCGNLWISEDGQRIFTACGNVYRASDVSSEDGAYNGNLGSQVGATWAAHTSVRGSVAVIGSGTIDTEVKLYGYEYLDVAAVVPLPSFPVAVGTFSSRGRMAFWNKAADRLFVLVQADPSAELESDWALVTFSGDGTQPGCTITPGQASVSMPSSGIAQFGVTSGSGCAWTAASDAAWLTVTGGGFGFGTGSVSLRAAPNTTGATRSATIAVGSHLVTLTQAAPCHYSMSGPAVFSATGGTGTLTITAGAGCTWTAATLGAPVTLTSPVSGSGTGAVGFQIAANTGNTIQFGRIAAGGQVFTITVRPAGYQPRFVFQNRTTNAVSSWLMGGTGSAAILQSPVIYTAAANWRVAAFADFNTDGIPDVVLQNRSTGAVSIWYMGGPSGMTIVSAPIIHTAYAGWNVAGAADLDNNGIADIVLQNATSNAISVWYLGAGAQLQSTPVIGTPLLNWRVAATADFDGNGTPDLVLQNVMTNGISIWYMGGAQGSTMLRAPFIRTAAAGWIVVGAAFLDGNTTPDLVLHNPTTGGVSFWFMDNSGESLLNAPIVAWSAANWSLLGGQ